MTDVPESLRSALADRYALERVIGRGGMATVYLAADLRHHRQVAVKVLRPDLAASIGTDRFLKEIEIAAGLTHPHIVPLYDSGEAAGSLYYVMPFIDGESLRTRLNREQRVSVQTATRITVDVADALGYAHRVNVFHRDIKPENILFAQGHAVVADFGIAKAITTAADATLTRTGIALGTPGYISPEQAAGIREIDARTDVYGLACVLYEMLIGETPGLWLTDEAVRLGRFIDASPQHRERLDRLSGSVEQVLVKALAMHPDKRYSTAAEFAEALQLAPTRTKKYGEREVREIIRRASELELTRPTEEGALSEGALQQVAAEAGISPTRVRDAIHQVDRPSREPAPKVTKDHWSWLTGKPVKIRVERIVEGEVPAEEFPYLVDEIRTSLGTVGNVSALGRTLAWSVVPSGQGFGRQVEITVTPRHGITRVFMEERLGNEAGGLFGGLWGGGGGGGLVAGLAISLRELHSPSIAIASALFTVGGSYLLARAIYGGIYRRRSRELENLADRLADHIARTGRPARELDDGGAPPLLGR